MRCQGKANKGKDIFSSRLKLAAKLYPKWMVRFHAGRIDFSGGDQRRRRRSSIQCQDIPRLCVATIIFTFPLFSEQRAVISSNFRIGCNNSVRVQSGFSQDSVSVVDWNSWLFVVNLGANLCFFGQCQKASRTPQDSKASENISIISVTVLSL